MKIQRAFIETFLFTLLVALLALILFLILGFVPQIMGYAPLVEYRTSVFISSFFYLFFISILQKRWGVNLKKMFVYPNSTVSVIIVILSISFYFVSAYVIQSIEDYSSFFSGYIYSIQFKIPSLQTAEIIQILNIALVSPIVEEIFFRGLVFSFLLKETGFLKSIIFSSILFSLFHFRFNNLFFLFILGCVLAFILYKTGSILLSIAAHMIFNLFSVFSENLKIPITSISNIQLLFMLLTLAICTCSLVFLVNMKIEPNKV